MSEMSLPHTAKRLRIYINEGDHWHGKPLDAALLDALRAQGVAGATLFRGAAGFGSHHRVHSTSIEVLYVNLPVVIEVIDTTEKIEQAVTAIEPMIHEGLVTAEDVQVVLQRRQVK